MPTLGLFPIGATGARGFGQKLFTKQNWVRKKLLKALFFLDAWLQLTLLNAIKNNES